MSSAPSIDRLREKIHACWLGKSIGGTLGGPHEGKPGPLQLSFYDPVPTESLPNDDLDLQIVWLHHLRTTQAQSVTPEILAAAWRKHVLWPPDEFGILRRNAAYGLHGPAQGAFDNQFGECMGAAIRSELWACLCPGEPAKAAALAWNDAVVDHCGEGVLAEIFHAALQSAAFVETKLDRLLSIALAFLPEGSRLKAGLLDTIAWCAAHPEWETVRQLIVGRYGTGNFTDVVCNLCFEVLGLYAGKGDFGATLCIATNCGLDTDCTAATLGSLLGIMEPKSIPPRWLAPIGENIVISHLIVDVDAPRDVGQMTDWTLELSAQLKIGDAPIGPILASRPEDSTAPTHLRIACETSAAEHLPDFSAVQGASATSAPKWTSGIAAGHWRRLPPAAFTANFLLFRYHFQIETDAAACVMTYYSQGACAWVDGRKVIDYTRQDVLADPFIAPSIHRSHCARKDFLAGELSRGRHELVVACRKPAGLAPGPVEYVIGIGTVADRFWLPTAFL